ncbi:MAG TPA: nucleotidyltransferase family protein [Nitrososphaerales archaeon]|nr:nucleotidyltransferase family protein [Nitrososphaerales archaeon]
MISGIILGAGASRRMGAQKQTLELDGKPMAQRVLDVFVRSSLDEVIVVLSPTTAWKPRRRKGLRIVINPRAGEGISTSVGAGLEAVDARSEAVVIGLADKPFLRKSTIEALVDAYRRSPAEILVPVYHRRRGNPVLFRRALFPQLAGLKGDVGAKVLVESGAYSVSEVPVDDEGVLFDVDTPEDLRKARKILSARSSQGKRKAGK